MERKELNAQVGRRVRQAREQAGMTQERLSALVGVSVPYLSDLERGRVGFSVPTLKRLCETLHVSADAMLMGRESENDISPIVDKLRRVSPEHLRILDEIISRYLEGVALERER